jgi:hypothetical protein
VELLMPAKSKKQERFMQAVANNPEFAKKAGVPQSVGKEFTMKKYQAGGMSSSPRFEGRKQRGGPLMEGRKQRGGAPMTSLRPKLRPPSMEMEDDGGAVERGNRAAMREAYDQETLARGSGMKMGGKVKKMKSGGKVRGAGMAQKGVRPCKMC